MKLTVCLLQHCQQRFNGRNAIRHVFIFINNLQKVFNNRLIIHFKLSLDYFVTTSEVNNYSRGFKWRLHISRGLKLRGKLKYKVNSQGNFSS